MLTNEVLSATFSCRARVLSCVWLDAQVQRLCFASDIIALLSQ